MAGSSSSGDSRLLLAAAGATQELQLHLDDIDVTVPACPVVDSANRFLVSPFHVEAARIVANALAVIALSLGLTASPQSVQMGDMYPTEAGTDASRIREAIQRSVSGQWMQEIHCMRMHNGLGAPRAAAGGGGVSDGEQDGPTRCGIAARLVLRRACVLETAARSRSEAR